MVQDYLNTVHSKNHKHVINDAPRRKERSWSHLGLPGIENSSTITSDAAMYIKVPAANEDVTMTSISLSKPCSRSPERIPSGVPDANKTINKLPLPISYLSKFLRIDIPSEREAAVL